MVITDLPPDVLDIVLRKISENVTRNNMKKPNTTTKVLALLSSTCKYLHSMIGEGVWEAAWNAYVENVSTPKPIYTPKVSYKENLLLHAHIGCQFCKTPRIRKIYYPFAMRCCTECLYAMTISGWRLKTDFKVPVYKYEHLPHTVVDMYAPRTGSYHEEPLLQKVLPLLWLSH